MDPHSDDFKTALDQPLQAAENTDSHRLECLHSAGYEIVKLESKQNIDNDPRKYMIPVYSTSQIASLHLDPLEH